MFIYLLFLQIEAKGKIQTLVKTMLAYISKTSSKHIHSKLQSKVLQFDIPSRIFHSLIWSMLQLQMTSAQGHMLSLEQHPFPPKTRQYIDFKPQKNLSFTMHVHLQQQKTL